MHLHCLQHETFEGPAEIRRWARERGHTLSYTHLYQDKPLPALDDIDWLVIMGGSMNIYQEDAYPWLVAEKSFLAQAIEQGKIALGVCLGAQLLADVLGGRVTRNPHTEIGWFPVSLTPEAAAVTVFEGIPHTFPALHWHGDTFDIPPDCERLAESEACTNQAFLYRDRVIGVQFHLEASHESIALMLNDCDHELAAGGAFVQSADDIRRKSTGIAESNRILFQLLDNMAAIRVA